MFADKPRDEVRVESTMTMHRAGGRWVRLTVDGREAVLDAAAQAFARHGLVVFPTETFYGLAVPATDYGALERLVALKAREPGKPIPVIAASRADVERIGEVPAAVESLIRAFWPGPLTIAILPTGEWPRVLLGNGRDIGVRVAGHALARELAALAGGLITATSANFGGRPAAARPDELDPELLRQVDVVIDAGACSGGLPSTVVAATQSGAVEVRRPGAVATSELARLIGYTPRVKSPTSASKH